MPRAARLLRRNPHAARASGGVTFLEVVFASAMLGAAAAAITSAFSTITRFTAAEETRLAANEVAHRLILQYLDDPGALHPDTDVFPMGRSAFRYLVNKQVLPEEDVGVAPDVTKRITKQAQNVGLTDRIRNLHMVTVEVYEDRGVKHSSEPLATISRIYNPLDGAEDDPDAFTRQVIDLFADQPEIQALLRQTMETNKAQQQKPPAQQQPQQKPANEPAPPGGRMPPRRIAPGATP